MKRILFVAFLMFGLLATASLGIAGPTKLISNDTYGYTVGKGDLETAFQIEPDLFRGDVDTTFFTLKLGANYFLTDIFAPGLEVAYWHLGGPDFFGFLPNLKAYWPLNNRILPYAQVGIGYFHGASTDLFNFALGPGVDFLLSTNVAVGMQFRYDLGVGDSTVHRIRFPIDFAIYFKI